MGIESTVLSLAGREAVLLRPGMISRAQIEELIGPVKLAQSPAESAAHASPGMHARHYSPKTPLVLVSGGRLPSAGAAHFVDRLPAPKPRDRSRCPTNPRPTPPRCIAILHEADAEGWDWIAVERPPRDVAWAAIRDRLERAAAR